jgi:hypothetical protein
MNPILTLNLNFRVADSSIVVKTPTYNRCSWMRTYMGCRSKRDRMAAIKMYLESGTEECIPGICARCEDPSRILHKKHPTNPHYNCLEKCCRLLHQWDMCESCVVHKHLQPDQRSTRSEVATFESVFSRLPDDVKRYICEFLPATVTYIESAHRLFREYGVKYGALDQHLKQPKSFWTNILSVINQSKVNVPDNNSSRKKICEFVKTLYKGTYCKYMQSVIEDSDFWYHRKYDFQLPKGSELQYIRALENINKFV